MIAQHQHVDQAEDCGVGPDRHRERQGGHSGVARGSAHRPQRIAQIAKRVLDEMQATCVPNLLLDQRDVSELPERGGPGIVGRQSGGAVEFDLPV